MTVSSPASGPSPGPSPAPHPLPTLPVRRFQSLRTIAALILREMGSTYGRSPGGYAWALLEPIGAILLLSVGFSLLIRTPSLGTSFLLFYATGYLPFSMFQTVSQKVATALRYSRALLAYPRVTWADAIIARFTLTVLTECVVFAVLVAGILALADTRAVIEPGAILIGLAMAALLGLAAGLMNALLFGLYPVWQQIWSILTRPLFLASGVFFLYDDMPKQVRDLLWWNPLLHATGEVRRGVYPTYAAPYVSAPYVFGIALGFVALGLLLLRRYHKRVLEA